jgi:hypothetical protein
MGGTPSGVTQLQKTVWPTIAVYALGEQQDPSAPASELSHHLAGLSLIAIAVLVIAGLSSDRLRPLQRVWPFLFVAAGLFLAAWSDGEIWPRGNLSWTWLVHHDAEARQHKTYAILLMVVGGIEYLRAQSKLNRFWRTWAFPLLALAGLALLQFHDHTAGSGALSPEARGYVVPWLNDTKSPGAADTGSITPPLYIHDHKMPSDFAIVESQSRLETSANQALTYSHRSDEPHHMTAAMLRVEDQHRWFAMVGLTIVVFKLIHDSAVWRRPLIPLLWPTCLAVLGILLVSYRE